MKTHEQLKQVFLETFTPTLRIEKLFLFFVTLLSWCKILLVFLFSSTSELESWSEVFLVSLLYDNSELERDIVC